MVKEDPKDYDFTLKMKKREIHGQYEAEKRLMKSQKQEQKLLFKQNFSVSVAFTFTR